jgi:hypothetical protein
MPHFFGMASQLLAHNGVEGSLLFARTRIAAANLAIDRCKQEWNPALRNRCSQAARALF